MGFFSGPSTHTLLRISQGIASMAGVIRMLELSDLDNIAKSAVIKEMKDRSEPTSMPEVIAMAASTIREQKMGWFKRNHFLGMIQGSLINVGVSKDYAIWFKIQVEIHERLHLIERWCVPDHENFIPGVLYVPGAHDSEQDGGREMKPTNVYTKADFDAWQEQEKETAFVEAQEAEDAAFHARLEAIDRGYRGNIEFLNALNEWSILPLWKRILLTLIGKKPSPDDPKWGAELKSRARMRPTIP